MNKFNTLKSALSTVQKNQLSRLIEDGPLTVGQQSPAIRKTLDILVEKGRAIRSVDEYGYARYAAVRN